MQTNVLKDQGFITLFKTSIAFLLFGCFTSPEIWGMLFASSVSYSNFLSYLNKSP